MGVLFTTPPLVNPVHAATPPSVYLSPTSQPLAPFDTLVTFNVSVANMPTFAAWDVIVDVGDPSILHPVSMGLVENFGGTIVGESNCVNGVGLGCDTRDGGGVAHSAAYANITESTGHYDSGNVTLFTVTFNSTATAGYTFLTLPSPVVSDPSGATISVFATGAAYGNSANAPVAVFSWSPPMPYNGDNVTFDGSASYDPSGGTITTYHWTIDGFGQTNNIPTTSFVFAYPGDHTVSLTVTDDKGLKSLPTVQAVNVIQRPAIQIAYSPASLSIVQRSSNISVIILTSIGNFTGTVSLTASVNPQGPKVSLSISSLQLTANGQNSTILSVKVGPTVAPGNYAVKVSGSSGTLVFYTIVGVSVTSPTHNHHQK